MGQCKALILTCMDYRIQEAVLGFADLNELRGAYDLIAVAGAQKVLADVSLRFALMKQIKLAVEQHGANMICIIAHEDCGAYGGSAAFQSKEAEIAAYRKDMDAVLALLTRHFPDVKIYAYICQPVGDGTWETSRFRK